MAYKHPNLHLLSDGFDRLLEPLVDFEFSTLKSHFGEERWWECGVLNVLRGTYRDAVEGMETEEDRRGSIDIGCALILMFSSWNNVYSHYSVDDYPGLVDEAPTLAGNLFTLRNKLAHHKNRDMDDVRTRQGLAKMALLCKCFDPAIADTIFGMMDEVGPRMPHTVGDSKVAKPSEDLEHGSNNDESESSENQYEHLSEEELFIEAGKDAAEEIGSIVAACKKSAEDQIVFDSLQTAGRKDNESVVHIESWKLSEVRYYICRITEALVDNSEYFLVVNNKPFPSDEVEISFYNRDEHTVVLCLGDRALDFINSQPSVEMKLVGDLSFLVQNVLQFYTDFGDMIEYSKCTVSFPVGSYPLPKTRPPTISQRQAIDSILNSGLSYVWGAPGTGKTQMVLASALVACVQRGQKVAVVAPTNIAVEQVLRGLISIIESNTEFRKIIDPNRDILRLGTASEEFLHEYPKVCENRILDSLIARKSDLFDRLVDVPFERELDRIADILKTQQILVRERESCTDRVRLRELDNEIQHNASNLTGFFESHNKMNLVGFSNRFVSVGDVDSAYRYVLETSRLNRDIIDYFDWADGARYKAIGRLSAEIEELIEMKQKVDNLDAKVIALTPHNYISRFAPRGYYGSKGMKRTFDVDHIFLDEAGYCSAILALPLLANHVPLTLLGDHMQLPPVCASNPEKIAKVREKNPESFKDPEFMRYWFLWDMSSIYIDTLFLHDIRQLEEMHELMIPPSRKNMQVCTLRESYRFGMNLGKILDRTVYRNGIVGVPGNNLEIECIDVPSPTGQQVITKYQDGQVRVSRTNICEVEAIKDYLLSNPMDSRQFAILTPYRDQVRALNDALPEYAFRNILSVHRSQGREWDTVVLSVADGSHTSELDHPTRFTSIRDEGLNLINTAVSRAKSRLIIVCDCKYWSKMNDELISLLLTEVEKEI